VELNNINYNNNNNYITKPKPSIKNLRAISLRLKQKYECYLYSSV